mmetsp:Transcript_4011/g.9348  ORF Transcript_4011/g.9348 Transcript_4011/m.9348 type:complete len:81 (+) Transcript_4011:850-1092(+)
MSNQRCKQLMRYQAPKVYSIVACGSGKLPLIFRDCDRPNREDLLVRVPFRFWYIGCDVKPPSPSFFGRATAHGYEIPQRK